MHDDTHLDLAGAHRTAAALAEGAATLLLELRTGLREGRDPEAIRADGDRRAHEWILAELRRQRPDDPVLSEEAEDDRARVGSAHAWIIDPLDGTREFGEPERTDWAVHVAFVVREEVRAAAVALPARHLVLTMAAPPRVPSAPSGGPRIAVSRTRPPDVAHVLAHELGGTLVPMGSAGAKTLAVVLGDADLYVHAGGQWEWDSAAPVGVAAAAGLHTSRLDGRALRYNQPEPWLPDLLVCRPELAPAALETLARVAG